MKSVRSAILGAFLLIATTFASPAAAQFWQCAPFARMVSGIEIYGNAGTWWAQADGRFDRGSRPRVGSVMVMKPYARMRVGHVAMVSAIVSAREIAVTHANWSRRGGVERDVRVVDVSPANDWSRVKVWYAGKAISARPATRPSASSMPTARRFSSPMRDRAAQAHPAPPFAELTG